MRARTAGWVAAALAALVVGCGSSTEAPPSSTPDGGPGNTGPSQFNLKVTTAGNGLVRGAGSADCRGSCSATYPAGTQVHLTAVADSGSTLVGWAGACGGSGTCDLTLDADREVSATFATAPPPPPNKHRATVVVQGKGRVTSAPAGLDCDSATCSANFDDGSSVSLTATASAGYTFAGWGNDCSGTGTCSLSLSRDVNVFANFVVQQVHLTVATTGPGTVTGANLNCGESSTGCDVTVAAGTPVTLTAAPAGGVRFFGWGGACTGTSTTCQLTLQADTKVTAEFQSEVLALAPNDGTNGGIIALNSTKVFWPRYSNGNAIWSTGKNGGAAVQVASGYATAIVADDSYLYWTDGSSIYSTPVGGGQIALLFSGGPIGKLALDETGALYWTVNSSGRPSSGSVHRMQNRTDTMLAGGQNPIGAVAVDATHLYWADYASEGGTIRRVPRKGGSVESVLSCGLNCYPQAIRLDPDNVYFRLYYTVSSAANGHVQAMSKSDFRVRILSNGNGAASYQYGIDLDVNASVVYWNWLGGNGPYGIFRANADGSGFKGVDTSNESNWYALRVDDTAVYYWHAGAIIRRLK